MIYIKIDNQIFYDDAVVLVHSFYPRTEVLPYQDGLQVQNTDDVIEIHTSDIPDLSKREIYEIFKKKLYLMLSQRTKRTLPWGYLTGVRPGKTARIMLEEGSSREDIKRYFAEHDADEAKAELAIQVAENEMRLLKDMDYKNGYSLYIGIPFCPSICLYCSFSSYPLSVYKDYTDRYLDALVKELEYVSSAMDGRRLDSVYVGGGTPTSLNAGQLDRLLGKLEQLFDMKHCYELTVEAGRPDSITKDRLKALREHQVERISINPQTMNQHTLDLIGRRHTVGQIRDAYALAREMGFDNINMDIIMALPGEGVREAKHTLREIEAMKPESLTVHSLAIKRAAALNIWRENYADLTIEHTDEIVRMTMDTAKHLGMHPYYMYRQKNMAGNFENVGYALDGRECIYNILIMEEKQTIIACGAGASSKIVFYDKADNSRLDRIERIENVKDVRSYVERIDEMILRKERFFNENEF